MVIAVEAMALFFHELIAAFDMFLMLPFQEGWKCDLFQCQFFFKAVDLVVCHWILGCKTQVPLV